MLPKMLYFHHKGYEEFQPSQADSGGCHLDFGLNDFGFWIVLFLKEEAC